MTNTECLNCAGSLSADFKFCPQCGQKTALHRLSLHDIIHESIHFFVHADKSIFTLLKALCTKTGTVAKEFIEGKRKKYFPPLNFFLLVTTIFVIMMTFAYAGTGADILKEHPEISHIPDPAKRAAIFQIYERQARAMQFMGKYSNFVSMIAIPFIAFIYWLFYKKSRLNYAENLVACMYMVGFTNLVYALVIIPLTKIPAVKHAVSPLVTFAVLMLITVPYSSVFYYRLMARKSNSGAMKAFAVSLFAAVGWFVLSGFTVGLYIANGFWGLLK